MRWPIPANVDQEGLPSTRKLAGRALAIGYAGTDVEPSWTAAWVGEDMHAGLKVALRDTATKRHLV